MVLRKSESKNSQNEAKRVVSAQILKGFEVFKGLDNSELAIIVDLCYVHTLNEGDRIFEEGTRATELHLCRRGKVDIVISVPKPWNKDVVVRRVEPGQLFGWSGLVAPYTYTASAVCVEAGEEICIRASELMNLFDRHPHLGYAIMTSVSAHASARLTQTRQRLGTELLASSSSTSSTASSKSSSK